MKHFSSKGTEEFHLIT